MRISIKGIILAVIAAIIGITLYFHNYFSTRKYFQENLDMSKNLLLIQLNIDKIKMEILQSSFFVYHDYDKIHQLIRETKGIFNSIKSNLIELDDNNKDIFISISKLQNSFDIYSKKVEKYLTLNSSLKSIVLNILKLNLEAFDTLKHKKDVLIFFNKLYSDVFIAKNSLDDTLTKDIKSKLLYLSSLEKEYPKESKEFNLLKTLRLNLVKVVVILPMYHEVLTTLLDNSLDKEIIKNIYLSQKESSREFDEANIHIVALLFLYLLALSIISYFIYKMDDENLELKDIKKQLEFLVIKDSLTSLKNMRAFNIDLREFRHPSLILINIDRFKHINEFYGTKIGDIVLIKTAQMLKNLTPKEFEIYRLGGDDFGILFENYDKDVGLRRWVEFYNKEIENYKFYIDNILIELKFSIGASSKKRRLFETADMALKMAKNSPKKFIIYSPKIDKTQEIKANIETISNISLALQERRLKAYFQPIYNLKTKKIEKYEALARIELKDGTLLKPYDFMNSAIEAKLSGDITLTMLEQSIEIAKNNRYEFSVNISSSDIESSKEREEIIKILRANQDVADRIIFELLESEDIYSYDIIDEFIKEVKKFGSKVAIDDFGSGYSNFEKILNLDIDILKVDGSLIKNIDTEEHSRLIVKTILQFAKYANFSTIAEFVYSDRVFEHIKNLDFDYAQGYYIGKPSPKIKSDDFLNI